MHNRRHSRLIAKLRRQGVVFLDPDTCYLDATVSIGAGTVVYPCVMLSAGVRVGKNCKVGPFAYLRPGTVLHDGVKIGDFVEIKNAEIAENTSISHLSYVGDADVGKHVNIGCGAVTCNYDGYEKHRTTIEDGAFIGCNTNLVAPVTIGRNAYTAAGSTITEDVPEGALAIARVRQSCKENWVKQRK